MNVMSFGDFSELMQNNGIVEFEVSFTGAEVSAPETGHKYIFVQTVTYCGDSDIKSSYRLWNSEDEFFMVYKNYRVSLSRRDIRTYIEETGSFESRDTDEGRMLPSVEYGLTKNKKYHARFSSEEYYLPPDRESGKPVKRKKTVLLISSKPFDNGKPVVDLTPLYKGWSY